MQWYTLPSMNMVRFFAVAWVLPVSQIFLVGGVIGLDNDIEPSKSVAKQEVFVEGCIIYKRTAGAGEGRIRILEREECQPWYFRGYRGNV